MGDTGGDGLMFTEGRAGQGKRVGEDSHILEGVRAAEALELVRLGDGALPEKRGVEARHRVT